MTLQRLKRAERHMSFELDKGWIHPWVAECIDRNLQTRLDFFNNECFATFDHEVPSAGSARTRSFANLRALSGPTKKCETATINVRLLTTNANTSSTKRVL